GERPLKRAQAVAGGGFAARFAVQVDAAGGNAGSFGRHAAVTVPASHLEQRPDRGRRQRAQPFDQSSALRLAIRRLSVVTVVAGALAVALSEVVGVGMALPDGRFIPGGARAEPDPVAAARAATIKQGGRDTQRGFGA